MEEYKVCLFSDDHIQTLKEKGNSIEEIKCLNKLSIDFASEITMIAVEIANRKGKNCIDNKSMLKAIRIWNKEFCNF